MSEFDRRVMKWGGAALGVFAIGVGMIAYSSTLPVPEQDVATEITQGIRNDGGKVDSVSCHRFSSETVYMHCIASSRGRDWVIPVAYYDDRGQWSYMNAEDRP